MSSKYFLYVDILGFSKLIADDPKRVDDLYQVVASLNVHEHHAFRTIVFSDTILIYNTPDPRNSNDDEYLVMFLCEFASDLQQRLVGRDIYFRAILTYGDFTHYTIKDVPCFYGQALIDANHLEKNIKCIGLFIDHTCNAYNRFYQTSPFDDNLSFVFLTQSLHRLERRYAEFFPTKADAFPITWEVFDLEESDLASEVIMIKRIYENMKAHSDESVKAKYTRAWYNYRACYPRVLSILEQNDFNLDAIISDVDWKIINDEFPEDYSYILETPQTP